MPTPLSAHDSAVWHTLWINGLLDRARFEELPRAATMFVPTLGQGEQVLAEGRFVLLDFVRAGDGTYAHKSGGGFVAFGSKGMVAATGVGLAVGALVRAVGNSSRRNAAALAAQLQWRQIDAGAFSVSQFGFYMHSAHAMHPWSWWSMSSAELIAPGQLMFTGESSRGPIRWILRSEWAELSLTLWARNRHPEHPQFLSGRWVPPGWAERVRDSGYGMPPVDQGRWDRLLGPGLE